MVRRDNGWVIIGSNIFDAIAAYLGGTGLYLSGALWYDRALETGESLWITSGATTLIGSSSTLSRTLLMPWPTSETVGSSLKIKASAIRHHASSSGCLYLSAGNAELRSPKIHHVDLIVAVAVALKRRA